MTERLLHLRQGDLPFHSFIAWQYLGLSGQKRRNIFLFEVVAPIYVFSSEMSQMYGVTIYLFESKISPYHLFRLSYRSCPCAPKTRQNGFLVILDPVDCITMYVVLCTPPLTKCKFIFFRQIIEKFDISPIQSRVAIVEFATSASLSVALDNYGSKTRLMCAVRGLTYGSKSWSHRPVRRGVRDGLSALAAEARLPSSLIMDRWLKRELKYQISWRRLRMKF